MKHPPVRPDCSLTPPTERYLRLTIANLKEAHARFHPRERQNDLS